MTLEVVEVAGGIEVVETVTEVIVETTTTVIEHVEIGIQGPAGPSGIPGPAGGAALQLIAGINLGGNRVVTDAATYADNTDLNTIGKAIGITAGAAVIGAPVNIVAVGELDGFFGLTLNEPVYLSINGTGTQTLPTTGYIQRVGVAISSTKILLNFSEPIGQI